MNYRICLGLALLTVLLPLSSAWATDINYAPTCYPMTMIYIVPHYTNGVDASGGGYLEISGGGTTTNSIFTPTYVTTLNNHGILKRNPNVYFTDNDQFTGDYQPLQHTSFARTFGWSTYGALPSQYLVKIDQTANPSGLHAYDPYSAHFAEVYGGAGGSSITWDGDDLVNGVTEPTTTMSMFHPVYAMPAQTASGITVDYTITLLNASDLSPVANFGSGVAELRFTSTPEPATMTLLALGASLLATRCRRTRQ